MRFLKQKSLSRINPTDQTLFTNQYGRAVMNLKGGLMLPKGTTAQRPFGTDSGEAGARHPAGVNGYIRYNTSIDTLTGFEIGIEAYIDGAWEVIRAPGESTIRKQTLGPGDGIETTFGPLERIPSSANNILVLVENVLQLSETNYNLVDNYLSSGNTYIVFTSPIPFSKNVTILFGFAN